MLHLTNPSPLNCSFQAMEREVRAAFGKGQPEEIVSCAFNLKVTREDIGTLQGLRWLNSEVKVAAAHKCSDSAPLEKYPFPVPVSLVKVI